MNARNTPEDFAGKPVRMRWVFLLPLIIPAGLLCITVWAWLQSCLGKPPAYAGEYFLWSNIALVTILAPLVVAIYVVSGAFAFKVFAGKQRTIFSLLLALPAIALALFWLVAFFTEMGAPEVMGAGTAVIFTLSLPVAMFAGLVAFRLSRN